MNKFLSKINIRLSILLSALFLGSCGEGTDGSSGGSRTGVGGSTARMTIVDDYLYAIAGDNIQLFDISQPATPNPWTKITLDWEIQTLFPYGDYLLIGAADGVRILDNTDPASPQYVADFTHATAIDPVVASDGFAYVTLKSDFTRPNGFVPDQMNVIDITNITDPQLVLNTPMQAPEGLTIAGDKLFVCDGVAGLKVFDISERAKPVFSSSIADVDCNDVIAQNGILYVITDTSFQQYDYSVSPPALLSEVSSEDGAQSAMLTIDKYQLVLMTIVLTSATTLSSCSRSKSKTEFIESALGTWQSGCQNYGINSEYGQVTLEVKESTFSFTNAFYEDPQCARPTVKYVSGGSLTKHERLVSNDERSLAKIDFLIEQITTEVLSDAKQVQFNNNATCELTSWAVGVNVDVSNCVDITDSNVPRTEYDIYSTGTEDNVAGVATDVLYTGMIRGATLGERPSAPDYQNPYWRIDSVASE